MNGRQRSYRVEVSSLRDHHGRRTGTKITMRDVTGMRESEQRLRVGDRVLRHNVRNDAGIIHGYASDLEDTLEGAAADDARLIRETAEGLLETADKARKITQLHENASVDDEPVDVAEQVREVVSEYQRDHPDVEFHVDLPASARAAVGTPETFRTAVRSVVDNAIEHNDTATLRLGVLLSKTADGYRVEVSDDGDGIPELERQVLDDGMETPLHHGQGLGLWLTYWCVRLWGGELALDSDADGSTVTMTIPEDREPGVGGAFGDSAD